MIVAAVNKSSVKMTKPHWETVGIPMPGLMVEVSVEQTMGAI